MECPWGCGKQLLRGELEAHEESCPKAKEESGTGTGTTVIL